MRGCVTCHSGESDSRGPDLSDVFGSEVRLKTGEVVVADEDYIMESIVDSGKKVVEGYMALMPSFKNQLTTEEAMNLIAYIKSLSSVPEAAETE